MSVQTFALESDLSENETVALFALGNNPAEPLFDKGLQGSPFPVGQFTNLPEEAI